jgi:hypothetical protein
MIMKWAIDDSPITVGDLMLIWRRNGRDSMGHNGILLTQDSRINMKALFCVQKHPLGRPIQNSMTSTLWPEQ